MRIIGERAALRDFEVKDLEPFWKWLQPGHAWRSWDAPYFPETDEEIRKRFRAREEQVRSGAFPEPRTSLVIADRNTDALIGLVNCYWRSRETHWLCAGIDIFDDALWGRGLGSEALSLWVEYLFGANPGIVRLGLETWSGNLGMIRLALRLGFKEEARIRKARIVSGEYYDALSFGVLREEWVALRLGFKGSHDEQ